MAATLRLRAALCLVRARLDAEWSATALYRSLIARPAATRFIAMARDFRPVSKERSQALLSGRFDLAGETLAIGADEDPWDRPSPSYAFAVALHRFDFLPDLMGAGDAGAREALRLVLVWRAEFGQISPLIWDEAVLTRRTFNLVCAAGPMLRFASDLESRRLADLLARSARRLLAFSGRGPLELERLIAAAVVGCTLASPAGRRLKKRALARLDRALGVHFDAQGALVRLVERCGVIEGRGACRHPDGVIRLVRSALEVFAADIEHHLHGNACAGSRSSQHFATVPTLEREDELVWE